MLSSRLHGIALSTLLQHMEAPRSRALLLLKHARRARHARHGQHKQLTSGCSRTGSCATDVLCPPRCVGDEVVIEDYLTGEEASLFALVDGEHVEVLQSAQVSGLAHHPAAGDCLIRPNAFPSTYLPVQTLPVL